MDIKRLITALRQRIDGNELSTNLTPDIITALNCLDSALQTANDTIKNLLILQEETGKAYQQLCMAYANLLESACHACKNCDYNYGNCSPFKDWPFLVNN